MLKRVLISTCLIYAVLNIARAQESFKKLDDGIVVYTDKASSSLAPVVKLDVVTDKIIHVTATPENESLSTLNLIVVAGNAMPVKWKIVQKSNQVLLSTPAITAAVSLTSGKVTYPSKSKLNKLNFNNNPQNN